MKTNIENKQPLSDAQLEIMNIIWDEGEVTVSQVWQKLQKTRPVARNTVQTLISRMAEKKWLNYRKMGNQFLYKPAIAKKSSVSNLLNNFLQNVFSGSTNNLIMTLIQNKNLNKEELKELKEMIQNLERKKDD